MNDAARQWDLYNGIWVADHDYGTRPRDVVDTVKHRIAPHMERVLEGFRDRENYVSVADFGAGDGRFIWEMDHQELITGAVGVDLYKPENLPGWCKWARCPMWEAVSVRAHFAISTDALEHLPPDRVNESLRVVANAAPHGFLRISLKEDRYGTERGLHLHESVFSSKEWRERLHAAGIFVMSERVYYDNHTRDNPTEAALEVWY